MDYVMLLYEIIMLLMDYVMLLYEIIMLLLDYVNAIIRNYNVFFWIT